MRITFYVLHMLSALALMFASGCADQADAPPPPPSPTIAAPARQSPTPGAPATTQPTRAAAPTVTPAAAAQRTTTRPEPTATPPQLESFTYLWPAYLPAAMRIAPAESRVAREGEIGQNGLGFFIVTFASGADRLVIGGGATDTLPLTGEQRQVSVAGRAATLTAGPAGRQVVFDVPTGVLFVYSSALSEEELLRVAGSLQPIELAELHRRVGVE